MAFKDVSATRILGALAVCVVCACLVLSSMRPSGPVEMLSKSQDLSHLRKIVKQQERIIARETSLLENAEDCNGGQVFTVGDDVKEIRCVKSGNKVSSPQLAEQQASVRDQHQEWCQKWCLPESTPHMLCDSCVDPSFPEYMNERKATETSNFGIHSPATSQTVQTHAASVQALASSPSADVSDRVREDVQRLEKDEALLVQQRVSADLQEASQRALGALMGTGEPVDERTAVQPRVVEQNLKLIYPSGKPARHNQGAYNSYSRHAVAAAGEAQYTHKSASAHQKHILHRSLHSTSKYGALEKYGGLKIASHAHKRKGSSGSSCHDFGDCLEEMFSGDDDVIKPHMVRRMKKHQDDNADRTIPMKGPVFRAPHRGGKQLVKSGVNVRGWSDSSLANSLASAELVEALKDNKMKPSQVNAAPSESDNAQPLKVPKMR